MSAEYFKAASAEYFKAAKTFAQEHKVSLQLAAQNKAVVNPYVATFYPVWLDEWSPKVAKKVTFLDIKTTAEPTQIGLEKLREKRRKAASKDQMKLPFKSKILWQTI